MKFTCTKANLFKGINTVMKAVPGKTTLQILECIMIEAIDRDIKLTANDTELGIETYVEGNVITPGKIAIDAKLLSDIVRKLPDSEIYLETDENNQTIIKCERAKFNIPGKSGEDFSFLPDVQPKSSITLSQFSLKEVIRQTIFSISDNENNKLMSGELFEVAGNHLKVVSLDGHRISIRNVELRDSYPSVKVVVPGKTLNDVSKILNGGVDDDVVINFSDNHIIFEFEKTKVVSRLLDGDYYNIEQMLSNDYATKITINKKEFLECIDRATLLIRESDKKPIVINISSSNLYLKMNSSIGQMDEEIEITKEGKDIMIGFNPRFLMDALRAIDDDSVDAYMVSATSPCIIKDEQGTYTYLILPVNINAANR